MDQVFHLPFEGKLPLSNQSFENAVNYWWIHYKTQLWGSIFSLWHPNWPTTANSHNCPQLKLKAFPPSPNHYFLIDVKLKDNVDFMVNYASPLGVLTKQKIWPCLVWQWSVPGYGNAQWKDQCLLQEMETETVTITSQQILTQNKEEEQILNSLTFTTRNYNIIHSLSGDLEHKSMSPKQEWTCLDQWRLSTDRI